MGARRSLLPCCADRACAKRIGDRSALRPIGDRKPRRRRRTGQAVHDSELLVGQLYFEIGAVYAVLKQDHKSAAQWYDKAVPLLTAPQPVSDLLTPQLEGEELVSMGVSYWQIGEKDLAMDLTLNEHTMTQQAVDRGVLPKSSLAVPYGNLATMYKQLGQTGDAAKYAELARQAGGTDKTKSAADTSDTKDSPQASTKPASQRMPRQMASMGTSNGAKTGQATPINTAVSAAQRARPGQPYNKVYSAPGTSNTAQMQPITGAAQSGNSGQANDGQSVARRQQDNGLSEPQIR